MRIITLVSEILEHSLTDAYQQFTVPKILLALNFFTSMALRFDSGAQIGQA